MKYISGIHALNLPCSLSTCGDWHQSSLKWENIYMGETVGSLFGSYGIEKKEVLPLNKKVFYVANHIRALLDLLVSRNFSTAQGMNEDYICNEQYDQEIFDKVSQMKTLPYWNEIDSFMGKEYKIKWLKYKEEHFSDKQNQNITNPTSNLPMSTSEQENHKMPPI